MEFNKYLQTIKKSVIEKYLIDIKEDICHAKLLTESAIDFPYPTLSKTVWNIDSDKPTLREENKIKILNLIKSYPKFDLNSIIKTIHIIGSICSNRYISTTDIDTHLIVYEDKLEEIVKTSNFESEKDIIADVMYYSKHTDENISMIGKHPIELYIQLNMKQDLDSDGCYDVISKKWLSGPEIVKPSFDPYEYYKYLFDDIKKIATKFDVAIGELKRDVIDYDVIYTALKNISLKDKQKLKHALENKVDEIEEDIKKLSSIKKDIIDARQKSHRISHDDKNWNDINTTFKFINRYHYLKIITDLENMMKDNKLSDTEITKIKRTLDK